MNGSSTDSWSQDYSDFEARAVPLIEVEAGNGGTNGWKIVTKSEGLSLLSRIHERVCVVAMAGQYRTGKSSLLNWLSTGKQEMPDEGFGVGHDVQRKTRGVWMWGRPLACRCGDGGKAAVILLDTEGLGGLSDVDDAYDATVFTLACLLSSTLVYNSLGTLDERAISNLGFCTRLSKRVRVRRGEEEEETRTELKKSMPKLVWVLRDFALELADEDGAATTADQYLERSLTTKSDATRNAILSYFPYRSCFCLPRPFANEDDAVLEKTNGLRPEFWHSFLAFRDTVLFHECPIKTVEGAAIRGSTLASLVVEYAKAFADERPAITGAWRAAIDSELLSARKNAVEAHAAALREQQAGDLATRHARGCRSADDIIRSALVGGGGSPGLASAVDSALRETRALCDAEFTSVRDTALKRRESNLKTQFDKLSGDVLAPAVDKTRAVFALADDPVADGAYTSLDDAELSLTRLLAGISTGEDDDDQDSAATTAIARSAARFAVGASFDAARAVSETADDRRDATVALMEQQKNDLDAKVKYLEGRDQALRESVDLQRQKTHTDLAEAMSHKTRLDKMEAALRAERTRAAEAIAEADKARAELADVAAALENEERWQAELQERLDMRIKVSQEREDELARRLERAQRKQKYTVLDFLLDDADDAAGKLNLESDRLEQFLAKIDLPNILPALKHFGAKRVSDLMYLEAEDLEDIEELDVVEKRRLMVAVDTAKAEYKSSRGGAKCVIS